jgi:6-pyruvoyltetrahydropterin/6-carboxytetrahydropterin synthase
MLSVTKVFRFEAAHVIFGYPGKCSRIHGHSYELHVTVGLKDSPGSYLPGTGMIIDFADLKKIVNEKVIRKLDHRFMVSRAYLSAHSGRFADDELVVMEVEPTAENLVQWFSEQISAVLPDHTRLLHLRLYETKDSYAAWENGSSV